MAKEIERKFLVKEGWREAVTFMEELCDGVLLSSRKRKVRVRRSGETATLAIKDQRRGAERNEFEYPIPLSDARELLEHHCDSVVTKTRYHIQHDGSDWIVDEYHGLMDGVVIAEIELRTKDQVFDKPPWLGKEVTNNPRYRKRNLVAHKRREKQKIAAAG
jgi:CYTH domain-containing protein